MRLVYPHLYVGGSTDLYMTLLVHDKPGESPIHAVLDCTPDLPTRKWLKAKHIKLRKIGFTSGKPLPGNKLKTAIEFIHQYRSENKAVLVGCRAGLWRSQLVCIAYLMAQKAMTWRQAYDKVQEGSLLGGNTDNSESTFSLPMVESVTHYIQNLYKKTSPPCDCRFHEHQVCDICQVWTGREIDEVENVE